LKHKLTICTKNRECLFGEIINGEMILSEYGKIVEKYWIEIPKYYQNVFIDEYIIMPNHVHGIIVIKQDEPIVGTIHELSLQDKSYFNDWLQRRNMLLSKIIGFFKMNSSKLIHQLGQNIFKWQRSFYDHVIRNEESLAEIRKYIQDNPKNWDKDINNLSFKHQINFTKGINNIIDSI